MHPTRPLPPMPARRIATSVTDPIQVDWTMPKIGLTFAPGKHDNGSGDILWRRNVYDDCRAIAAAGGRVLVTLLEDHELPMLKVEELGAAAKAAGLLWIRFPIRDVSTPTPEEADAFDVLIDGIVALSGAGLGVVIHCRGGKGRAGLVGACATFKALVASRSLTGEGDPPTPADVVRLVRSTRKGTIETTAQERYVFAFARRALPAVDAHEPGWTAPEEKPVDQWFGRRESVRGRSWLDEDGDIDSMLVDLATEKPIGTRGGRR